MFITHSNSSISDQGQGRDTMLNSAAFRIVRRIKRFVVVISTSRRVLN